MKPKKKAPAKPVGRPSKYTKELGIAICEEISNSSKGIHKIAANHGVTASMVMRWLAEHQEFREHYARAKDLQADYMIGEAIDIADENTRDTIYTDKGEIPDNEWINRSKLRVDIRKWQASKLAPKKYGDKIDVTSDNKPLSLTAKVEIIHTKK